MFNVQSIEKVKIVFYSSMFSIMFIHIKMLAGCELYVQVLAAVF